MRMGCWEDALAARSKLEGLLEAGHLWLVDQPGDIEILGLSLSYSVGVMGGRGYPLAVPHSDLRLETVAFSCSAS